MPFNGSGVFQRVRNWVADATAGIKIRADYHDTEDDGFATGLSNCITKDGQTIVTQNIPMNSKRLTGLADPVNPQDAATKASADAAITTMGAGKVSKTGDTMSGNLTTTGNLISATAVNMGTVQLGSDAQHYVNFNGLRYVAPNGPFTVWPPQAGTDAINIDWTIYELVLNGGGGGMTTADHVVRIGWDGVSKLVAQVDATPLGYIVTSTTALTMESLLARIEALESKGT